MICPLRPFVTWLRSVEHWTFNSVGSGSTGRWYYLKSWYPTNYFLFYFIIYFLHPVDVNVQKVYQYFHPTQTTTIHLNKKKFPVTTQCSYVLSFLLDSPILYIHKILSLSFLYEGIHFKLRCACVDICEILISVKIGKVVICNS